jgi:hypothetical protein
MGQIRAEYPIGQASGIAVYDNVFGQEFLGGLLQQLSMDFEQIFEQGPTIGGIAPFMKLCMDTELMNPTKFSPEKLRNFQYYENVTHEMTTSIWSCVVDYVQNNRHLWNAPSLGLTGMRIQRYFRNYGYYREHCDGLPWLINDINEPIRILAVVAYLNDISDGGGTHFPMHEYTSEPRAGRVVIFPTTWQYPHMGQVPLSGDKWIISSFITVRRDTPGVLPFDIGGGQENEDEKNSSFTYPETVVDE